jgi:hypothetical protein
LKVCYVGSIMYSFMADLFIDPIAFDFLIPVAQDLEGFVDLHNTGG